MREGPPPRWWNWYRFPLVPDWRYRPGNDQNTPSFYFHWLAIRLWTMDSVMLGFEVELDDSQFYARLKLPYLIAGLFFPIFPERFHQKLWRKTPWHKRIIKEERDRKRQKKLLEGLGVKL